MIMAKKGDNENKDEGTTGAEPVAAAQDNSSDLPFAEESEGGKTIVKDKETDTVIAEGEEDKNEELDPAAIMKLLKDLTAKYDSLEAKQKKIVRKDGDEDEESLAEDYLEDPVVFFSYSFIYTLWGDKRKGKIIGTPNKGALKFERHYRFDRTSGGGRGTETVSVSRLVSHSARDVKFIREHSLFGIKFFESITSAIDADVLLAEKMVSVSAMVSSLGDMKVIDRAKQEDIKIDNPDVSQIRKQLTQVIAYREIEEARKQRKITVNAQQKGKPEEKKIGEAATEHGDTGAEVYS